MSVESTRMAAQANAASEALMRQNAVARQGREDMVAQINASQEINMAERMLVPEMTAGTMLTLSV